MAQYYNPKTEVLDYLRGLSYGFYLETATNGKVVLLIKVEPSIMDSIINGCPIELVIRNPSIFKRSCTLYVYDLPNEPFYVTWHKFSEEDEVFVGFDKVAINIALRSTEIKLVLYNDLNHAVFSTNLEIASNPEAFELWAAKTYNSVDYQYSSDIKGDYFPEDEKIGFKVTVLNVDNSETEKISILSPEYTDSWRQNPMSKGSLFNHSIYQGDGKHGSLQELAIASKLNMFFEPEKDFFSSPRYANGLEFTDFIIFDKNAAIIIESKYVFSYKPTRKHSNISKAIEQLGRSEAAIMAKLAKMENSYLEERLSQTTVVLKVCLVNDRIQFDEKYRQTLAEHFEKWRLPIFISVTVFSDYLTALKLKNPIDFSHNVFSNLLVLYTGFLKGNEKIPLIDKFQIEGFDIKELNELGKSRLNS